MKTQPTPTELLAHWRVAVEANGVLLVAIESDGHLAGCEISEHDEQVIRKCAQHLLAFLGDTTLSAREDGWQPIETAPRDGTYIRVQTANGEDNCRWEEHRYCMIGAPQGSFGPGWVDSTNHLPMHAESEPTHWWKSPKAPTAGEGK